MGQQVFKNENFYIDETKSNYIEQLQTMYQKDIVVPEMKYKEFLEKLYEKFSLKETTLSGIDKVTYATLNSNLINLDRSKIWIVINDESVKNFYKYYYQRFFNKSYVCLVYVPNLDTFYSNCSLFEAYIKIIRGINEEEIVKNTFKYRDYLNTMYQYQKLITELKNS